MQQLTEGFIVNYARQGMLESIILPTGGSEVFNYEANTYPNWEELKTDTTIELSGSGNSHSSGTWQYITYYSLPFQVYKSQTAHLTFTGDANPGCEGTCTGPSSTLYANLNIDNLTDLSTDSYSLINYGTDEFDVSLTPGEYVLTLRVKGMPNAAIAQLSFDAAIVLFLPMLG